MGSRQRSLTRRAILLHRDLGRSADSGASEHCLHCGGLRPAGFRRAAGPGRAPRRTAGSLPAPTAGGARRRRRGFRRQGRRRGRRPRRCRATPHRPGPSARRASASGAGTLATTAPAPTAKPTRAKAGPASCQPWASGHDQVAHAGDDGGADQGACAAEPSDQAVGRQSSRGGSRRRRRRGRPRRRPRGPPTRSWPASTRTPASIPCRPARDATIRSRIRRRRSAKRSRTPSQAEVEDAFGLWGLRAEADEREAGQHQRNGVGEERDRLAHGEEPGSDDRPGEVLRGRFGAGQHAVGVFERVGRHEVGNDGLQRGVVDRPRPRVDEHDEDQRTRVIRSLKIRKAPPRMASGTDDVGDGHEWAPFEPVGERAGGQRQQEPRKAVRGHDAGDGQRVGIDDDGEQRNRPGREARHRSWPG